MLGELFNAIHRALLGSAAEKAADPQLPVKIRLSSQSQDGKAVPNGVPGPSDAAAPQSLVQRLFGLQVQACPHQPHAWQLVSIFGIDSVTHSRTDAEPRLCECTVPHCRSVARNVKALAD